MASAQVCRFQRRISHLHNHHESALKRHSVANQNYLSLSRDVMNSLFSNLSEEDHKLKKSKRINRIKRHPQQLSKSTRYNEHRNPLSCQSSCVGLTAQDLSKCDPDLSMSPAAAPSGLCRQPYANDFNAPYGNVNSNEPIFPPPIYADSARSLLDVFPVNPSHNFNLDRRHTTEDYTPFAQPHHQFYQENSSRHISYVPHPDMFSPRVESGNAHAQSVTWSPRTQCLHPVYPEYDNTYFCEVSNNPEEDRVWASSFPSPRNPPSVSHFSPPFSGINPILAFTYPTNSGNRPVNFSGAEGYYHSHSDFPPSNLSGVPSTRCDLSSSTPPSSKYPRHAEYSYPA